MVRHDQHDRAETPEEELDSAHGSAGLKTSQPPFRISPRPLRGSPIIQHFSRHWLKRTSVGVGPWTR